MRKRFHYVAALFLLISIWTCINVYRDVSGPIAINSLKEVSNDSENLLLNPGFESIGRPIAEGWENEYTTYGVPVYFVSGYGAVDGSMSQYIEYSGRSQDNGTGMVEIFQVVRGVKPGDVLKFSLCVSGSFTKTPAVIGIESFNNTDWYVGETDEYIEGISMTPRYYDVVYTCPNETDWVAVFLQCQEVVPDTEISVYLDDARLVQKPLGYVEVEQSSPWKTVRYLLVSVLLCIPTMVILSEIAVRINNLRYRYVFSGNRSDDYKILVPIWGNIKYLENIKYLSKYGLHVVLCTTGDGSDEFYTDLNKVAVQYGFNVFVDKTEENIPLKQIVGHKERTTSGCMRDRIIRNALQEVDASYVVTLDADSTTDEDMSVLVGELDTRQWDIASIRIVPDNGDVSVLTRLQVFEYETAMNFRYLCPWLISGACHTAKTHVLRDIMSRHSLFFQGNDVETGLLAQTLGYKVGHIPFVVRTSVPENFYNWIRQRLAWAGGEFRLYIVNFRFILRHPFFWFYGAVVTVGLFPFRWLAFSALTPALFIIIMLYIAIIFYTYWDKRSWFLLMMPMYTLLISLVISPLGILWYFYVADQDDNYGLITVQRVNK